MRRATPRLAAMVILLTAGVLFSIAVAAGSPAANSTSFDDPSGDHSNGPDITRVRVTNRDDGRAGLRDHGRQPRGTRRDRSDPRLHGHRSERDHRLERVRLRVRLLRTKRPSMDRQVDRVVVHEAATVARQRLHASHADTARKAERVLALRLSRVRGVCLRELRPVPGGAGRPQSALAPQPDSRHGSGHDHREGDRCSRRHRFGRRAGFVRPLCDPKSRTLRLQPERLPWSVQDHVSPTHEPEQDLGRLHMVDFRTTPGRERRSASSADRHRRRDPVRGRTDRRSRALSEPPPLVDEGCADEVCARPSDHLQGDETRLDRCSLGDQGAESGSGLVDVSTTLHRRQRWESEGLPPVPRGS